jgi:hypothetical protein
MTTPSDPSTRIASNAILISERRYSNCLFILIALNCFAVCGCGRSATAPGTIRAGGTVTLSGKPVAGANVIFYPASSDVAALASQSVTDDSGRFQLSTHVGGGTFKAGITPGKYAVAITKLDTAGISNTLGPPKSLLPRAYANPKTSKLSAEVSADRENDFKFNLTPE